MTKFRRPDQLKKEGYIKDDERLNDVVERFSLSITGHMASLIDKENGEDPIAKQFIPSTEELNRLKEELADPIGDEPHSPVKGIIHRYRDRCLFMPISVCPVYCRFCFRREQVGSSGLTRQEMERAFEYIEAREEIWEVILSGGDPLFMPPARLDAILTRLASIEHVEINRIHTRVPIVDPERITNDLIKALKKAKVLYIVLHANHPKEFTPEAEAAIAKLVDAGIPMLSQSVLLKGINDNAKTLEQLFRLFVKNRIKPYYLHQGDLAEGTSHFRTTIAEGQKIMKELRGRVSGLCQPEYVLDIPGGHGKVPLTPVYYHGGFVEDCRGRRHRSLS